MGGGVSALLRAARTRFSRGRFELLTVAVASLVFVPIARAETWEQVGPPVAQSSRRLVVDDLKRIQGTEYVAWTASNGRHDLVRVARLDRSRQAWVPVGGPVNHDQRRSASCASLGVGTSGTPWIAWGEFDSQRIFQARVAHFDVRSGRWIEPDGRDWSINYRPPLTSEFYLSEGQNGRSFGASCPKLIVLGDRPYVSYVNYAGFGEQAPRVARLAPDGHSWRQLDASAALPTDQGFFEVQLAVIARRLYAGESWGVTSQPQGHVYRANSGGTWSELGCINCTADWRYGLIDAFGEQEGIPTALWTAQPDDWSRHNEQAYVVQLRNGQWQPVAAGPLGTASAGLGLRTIGGRLYVKWTEARWLSGFGIRYGPTHLSRLSEDAASWEDVADPPLGRFVLSGLNGVPYAAGVTRSGTARALRVARLIDSPTPIGADDGEGSGAARDPHFKTASIYKPPLGGLRGVVIRRECRPGKPCRSRSAGAYLQAIRTRDQFTLWFKVAASGHFRIDLPPGNYRIRRLHVSRGGTFVPGRVLAKARVVRGQHSFLRVYLELH